MLSVGLITLEFENTFVVGTCSSLRSSFAHTLTATCRCTERRCQPREHGSQGRMEPSIRGLPAPTEREESRHLDWGHQLPRIIEGCVSILTLYLVLMIAGSRHSQLEDEPQQECWMY